MCQWGFHWASVCNHEIMANKQTHTQLITCDLNKRYCYSKYVCVVIFQLFSKVTQMSDAFQLFLRSSVDSWTVRSKPQLKVQYYVPRSVCAIPVTPQGGGSQAKVPRHHLLCALKHCCVGGVMRGRLLWLLWLLSDW